MAISKLEKKVNIHVICGELGEFELKRISYLDAIEIDEITKKLDDERSFVIEVLFHQLIKPTISKILFVEMASKELRKIVTEFVDNQPDIFINYKDCDTFDKEFKNSYLQSRKKHREDLQKTFEPYSKSIIEFRDIYLKSIKNIYKCNAELYQANKSFEAIRKSITQSQEIINENIKLFLKNCNDKIFKELGALNESVQSLNKYNTEEKQAVEVLRKYKWFISPNTPISFIYEVVKVGQEKGRQDKNINTMFVSYFEENNWENLYAMVQSWKGSKLLKKRYKILLDCTEILLLDERKINKVNVILPTLVVQIDGILTDFLRMKGLKWSCSYDDYIDKKNPKNRQTGRKTLYKTQRPEILTSKLDELATDILLEILLRGNKRGKLQKNRFNFNRHKIIHGESVKYGRKDYLVRAFMLMDLLAHLK